MNAPNADEPAQIRALFARRFEHLDTALGDIVETAAAVLDVSRVSVWLLSRDRRRINRVCCWPAVPDDEAGLTLDISLRPEYLQALDSDAVFRLSDAAEMSPRSGDAFSAYLSSFGIVSLLDAAVYVDGVLTGVLCHEDSRPRQWSTTERDRAIRLGAVVGRAIVQTRAHQSVSYGERFRRIVEASVDAIGMARPDGGLEYLNPSAREILGLAPDEPIAEFRLMDFIQPDSREHVRATIFPTARRNGHWTGPLRMRTRQRERFDATITIDVHRDSAGAVEYISCTIGDLARNLELERRVNEVRSRYESAFAQTGDSVFLIDPVSARILDSDASFRELLGYSASQQALVTLHDISEEAVSEVEARITRALRDGHVLCGERRLLHARGGWMDVEMSMLRTEWQDATVISVRLRDIAELVQRRRDIEQLAYFDPLTGLANSNLLRERADGMLEQSLAGERTVHFMLLQIVRWERVFDIQGYRIAESLIQQIGTRLQDAFNGHDATLARVLGGGELGLLFDEREDPERMVEIAREAFEPPFMADAEPIHLRVRSGMAQAPRDAVNFKDLTKRAGLALRHAHLHSMAHCRYDPTHSSRIQDERLLEEDLREALESDQLSLRYQPVRSIARQGAWSAVEVLLRWHHPQLGEVAPTDFVPLAEDSELILDLDRRTLNEACTAAAGWQKRLRGLRVSVNISAVTLMHPQMLDLVEEAIRTTHIEASQLCLEVTETAVMRDRSHAASVLRRLHDLGVYIALDDFGTGFSSLAYLKDLPVDVLKIDRDFVRGIGTDTRDERTILAIIQLGHDLGLKVVAEGVETRSQYAWLARRDVDFVQGFHVGAPVRAEQLARARGVRSRQP